MRLLSTLDLDRAVHVQSSAFQNDPLWQYLIPSPKKRANMLPMFFRVFLKASIRNRQAYGFSDPVKGVAIWHSPHQKRIDFIGLFRAGVLGLLFHGFLSPFLRALKVLSLIENLQEKYASESHYYLNTLAIIPEAQGKGHASKLVMPFLKKADEESVGIYVETMKLSNVGLYAHYGFQCMEQCHVPKTEVSIWAFYRPAKRKNNPSLQLWE
jgi:ribosomal protein S18 acetylase RimI-like enzyme